MNKMSAIFLSFQHTVESALKLVLLMELSDQLKAVEFWNTLSEDLQDSVNRSVAEFQNVKVKVEKDEINSDTDMSSSIPDTFEESIQTPLINSSTQNEIKDFYILNAVIDLPQEGNEQVSCVHIMDDLPIRKQDTRMNDVNVQNEGYQKTDNVSKVSEPSSTVSSPQTSSFIPLTLKSKRAKKGEPSLYRRRKGEYPCDLCDKAFRTAASLHSHRAHKHTGTYACQFCKKWCSSRGSLIAHTRTHTGEKPYSCKLCGKSFKMRNNLTSHARTHTGEKPHECEICHQRFTQNTSLKEHINSFHSGLKPYKCQVCDKDFARRTILRYHTARMHSSSINEKTKVFRCESCEEVFLLKSQLISHNRIHTGESAPRPFKCEICAMTFVRQTSLDQHANKHNGVKPFKCEDCKKKFHTTNSLMGHRKICQKRREKHGPPKQRKKIAKEFETKNNEETTFPEADESFSKFSNKIFAFVLDSEMVPPQMANQALLYNPETQETIPAGENMESVLEAINSLAKSSATR